MCKAIPYKKTENLTKAPPVQIHIFMTALRLIHLSEFQMESAHSSFGPKYSKLTVLVSLEIGGNLGSLSLFISRWLVCLENSLLQSCTMGDSTAGVVVHDGQG